MLAVVSWNSPPMPLANCCAGAVSAFAGRVPRTGTVPVVFWKAVVSMVPEFRKRLRMELRDR
jgi:hypothetical protein